MSTSRCDGILTWNQSYSKKVEAPMIEMSRPTQEKSEKLGLNKWSDSQNSK